MFFWGWNKEEKQNADVYTVDIPNIIIISKYF